MQRESGKRNVDPLPSPRPPIEEQLATANDPALRGGGDEPRIKRYERLAINRLNDGTEGPPGGVYAFVPTYYDAKFNQRAQGTIIYVYQKDGLSDRQLLESQVAMREIASETFRETPGTAVRVYGRGVVNDELDRSTTDSLLVVGPLALVLVVAVLLYAYRDPLDVLLALTGVGLVLLWTFGFMGWAGIELNQLFVSIPVFLMGLSIDYAIHAVMRYREEREEGGDPLHPRAVFLGEAPDPGVRQGMVGGIAGVGSAFVLVTFTTATGFASSVASPVQPIREFGLVAAVGIVATLVVFGALVPALKTELDEYLEVRGHDRRDRAFATGEGRLNDLLERFVRLGERTPWLVVGLALLATSAGLAGATTVDTTFDQQEFHVEETPAWMDSLPEPLKPGTYTTRKSLEFFRTRGFVNDRNTAHILVEGNVTHPETLERTHRAHERGWASNATHTFGRRDLRVGDLSSKPVSFNETSPVGVMRAVASDNQTFNATFSAADTDGDRVPDRNLETVYDALYETNPAAARNTVYRENGEYRALRLGFYINGSRGNQLVADGIQQSATIVDEHPALTATATGRPIIRAAVQQQLFTTILRGFAITLAVVFVLLVVVYRLTRDSASLGVVTMLPVLFAVAWILGTMAALGMRFNVLTALITSFTIGLGVDYSIHISERYVQELDRQGSVAGALRASVFGTGGALLGSALTDVGGFGVLAFALLNPLQQFGLITAMTIIYAFLGSVVVLPSLLVLWTRHVHGADVPRVEQSRSLLGWRPDWWRE
jgi:predicted RND superfamily exporter protein